MVEGIRHKAFVVLKRLRSLITVRSVGLLLAIFILATGGQRIAGSWLIPAGSVSRQAVQALAKWTGYEVVSSGRSGLSFWPTPKVTVEGVMLLPPGAQNGEPLMTARKITGSFSIMSVFLGDPVFKTIELEEPEVTLAVHDDGTVNWAPAGKLGELLTHADRQGEIASAHLGRLLINAGKLHIKRGGAEYATIESIHGTLDLKSGAGPLALNLDGKFKGQAFSVTASATSISDLIFGNTTSVSADLSSSAGSLGFSGTANMALPLVTEGRIKMASSDTGAFSTWLGLSYPALQAIGDLNIDGSLASEGSKFTLSDLKLQAGSASANGALLTGWSGPQRMPFLSGTLAFDRFDAQAFMAAFIRIPARLGDAAFDIDTSFLKQLQLDLRFSSSKASFGPVAMTDIAAGARIADGHGSFSLATGQFSGGSFSGELMLDDNAEAGRAASVHLEGTGINLANVPKAMRPTEFWPEATATLNLDAKAALPNGSVRVAQTLGSLKLEAGAGTLQGFNAAAFRDLAGRKRFFDIAEAADGSLPFDKLEVDATLVNGVAELQHAALEGTDGKLSVSGIVPFQNSTIALSGALSGAAADALPDLHFFAGGAWPTIVISPASTVLNGQ